MGRDDVTQAEERRMHRLRNDGLTIEDIAREMGRSISTVSEHLNNPEYIRPDSGDSAADSPAQAASPADGGRGDDPSVDTGTRAPTTTTGSESASSQRGGARPSGSASPLIDAIERYGQNDDGTLSKPARKAIDSVHRHPDKYMNNRQNFKDMLRAQGFQHPTAESIVREAEWAIGESMEGRPVGGAASTGGAASAGSRADQILERVMEMYETQFVIQSVEPMFTKLGMGDSDSADDGDDDGMKSMQDLMDRLTLMQGVKQMFDDGSSDGDGDDSPVQMVDIPAKDENGNMTTRSVPVRSEGGAMMQMMIPMMRMMGNSGSDRQEIVELATAMTSNQPGLEEIAGLLSALQNDNTDNDRVFELFKEQMQREREYEDRLVQERMERIEEALKDDDGYDDPLSALSELREYDDMLGLFGGNENYDPVEMKQLEIDNMDKMVEHRMRMLDKIQEMEQQKELTNTVSGVLEKGIGNLTEPVGEQFGNQLFNDGGQPMSGQGAATAAGAGAGMGAEAPAGGGGVAPTGPDPAAGDDAPDGGGGQPPGPGPGPGPGPAPGGDGGAGGGNGEDEETRQLKRGFSKAMQALDARGQEEFLRSAREDLDRRLGGAAAGAGAGTDAGAGAARSADRDAQASPADAPEPTDEVDVRPVDSVAPGAASNSTAVGSLQSREDLIHEAMNTEPAHTDAAESGTAPVDAAVDVGAEPDEPARDAAAGADRGEQVAAGHAAGARGDLDGNPNVTDQPDSADDSGLDLSADPREDATTDATDTSDDEADIVLEADSRGAERAPTEGARSHEDDEAEEAPSAASDGPLLELTPPDEN